MYAPRQYQDQERGDCSCSCSIINDGWSLVMIMVMVIHDNEDRAKDRQELDDIGDIYYEIPVKSIADLIPTPHPSVPHPSITFNNTIIFIASCIQTSYPTPYHYYKWTIINISSPSTLRVQINLPTANVTANDEAAAAAAAAARRHRTKVPPAGDRPIPY